MSRGLNLLDRLYLKLRRRAARSERARALADELSVQGPELVAPPQGRVLVLAPHPDDESIGAGGLILSLPDRAERVAVALFTGGEQGRADWQPGQTQTVRSEEMQRCLDVLGLTQFHALGGRDQQLLNVPQLATRLAALMRDFAPEHIALPCYCDAHLDHRHVNELFLAAADAVGCRATIWAYEVWTPCPANVALDISAVAEAKGRAIEVHTSQDSVMHYRAAALGLNRYRATQANWQGAPAMTHAEAYLRLPCAEYARRARQWYARIDGADVS